MKKHHIRIPKSISYFDGNRRSLLHTIIEEDRNIIDEFIYKYFYIDKINGNKDPLNIQKNLFVESDLRLYYLSTVLHSIRTIIDDRRVI